MMVVTACVIPVAVVLVFVWMVKLVFKLGFLLGVPDSQGRIWGLQEEWGE